MTSPLRLTVNGFEHVAVVEDRTTLADYLRDAIGLTGTHLGCEHGVCGACTVLFDGLPVRSCLVLAHQAEGAEVETVEGLALGDELHPLQEKFSRWHALQCGFCTPGFLMLIEGALRERPDLSDEDLREVVSSNLCRCTGYRVIHQAAISYRDQVRGEREGGSTRATYAPREQPQ